MTGQVHSPDEFADSISTKLASRSRHVCVFLGGGASAACGLPTISDLEDDVKDGLADEEQEIFEALSEGRDLEEVLSRLRRIANLAEEGQQIDELTRGQANDLDESICQEITNSLDLERADIGPMDNFASWANRVGYQRPLEVFTVNYDLLIESAFENTGLSYFDGFVGNLRARFKTDLVERTEPEREDVFQTEFVRLWKIHGSINWGSENGNIVRLGQPVTGEKAAAIYPSHKKYDESRRVPYLVLQDRFRRALHEDETLVIISGYSFGDQHLNEIIFQAAARRPRSDFIVFCHSEIPHILVERGSRIPNLTVAGPMEAYWPDQGEWKPDDDLSELIWDDGSFGLTDFTNLAEFLSKSDIERETPQEYLIPYDELEETSAEQDS